MPPVGRQDGAVDAAGGFPGYPGILLETSEAVKKPGTFRYRQWRDVGQRKVAVGIDGRIDHGSSRRDRVADTVIHELGRRHPLRDGHAPGEWEDL